TAVLRHAAGRANRVLCRRPALGFRAAAQRGDARDPEQRARAGAPSFLIHRDLPARGLARAYSHATLARGWDASQSRNSYVRRCVYETARKREKPPRRRGTPNGRIRGIDVLFAALGRLLAAWRFCPSIGDVANGQSAGRADAREQRG